MSSYRAPLTDMQFLLRDVFKAEELFAAMPATEEATEDLISAILEEAAKMVEGLLAPINQNGDLEGCHFDAGVVTTPRGFKEAFKAYAEGGWPGLTGNVDYGGQGMPTVLSALLEEMAFAANSSFALYTVLTTGVTHSLNRLGSTELKDKYLGKLYEGSCAGSMCLTEAQAGTDLGMIRTRAVPSADGNYEITGTKIFITAGEHDLTENIIHLVLAKLADAPAGARGLSLFLVPKFIVDDAGNLAERNQVECGSIEHKMGIRASATCVLNFDAAKGYLVGELNAGMSNMFTLMNYARLSMGLQGNGLADASYQVASAYAKERIQGRSATGPQQADKAADPILVHPDVRRMLLTMRSNIVAGRALSMYAAMQLDISWFHPDAGARKRAEQLVALLIPVQKAYCTDRGFEACVLAQQVLGGHGYIVEWGLEQNVRDARIAQIYEGTNGVQALDLMGRKIVRSNGELLQVLLQEMDEFTLGQRDVAVMKAPLRAFEECKQRLIESTELVIKNADTNPDEIGAASYAYLQLMGLTLYCFMWQRVLAAAYEAIDAGKGNQEYHDGLVKTGKFFIRRLLPHSKTLAEEIAAGPETLMEMTSEQF